MKTTKNNQWLTRTKITLVVAVVIATGLTLKHSTFAATDGLSFSPGSSTITAAVGSTFNVTVQEDSGSTAASTIDTVVNFPSNLQFVSDTNVAPFSYNPNNPSGSDAASGNSVYVTRSQIGTSSTGPQTVTVLTFQVKATGSTALSFNAASSDILTATVPSSNILTNSPGVTYTINAPTTPPPAPTPTPTPTPTPVPAPTPVTTNPKSGSVSVSKTGSGSGTSSSGGGTTSSVTVPNNGSVAVTTPVGVEPTTIQSDGVTKVQYYLAGKLVDTETRAPYKYNIDTTKLKSGTYKLVSKTYYTNGTTKQTTQHLIVKNAASKSSNLTWLYLLIVGVILLLGLGVNFIGPSVGGPFHRPFAGHGPTPAGWPTGSVPPSGGGGSAALASLNPSQPTVDTRLSHLEAPHGPNPGTVFRPHE